MYGHIIAPDDLKPGQFIAVRSWRDLNFANVHRAHPMLVHAILLPFVAVEYCPLDRSARGVLDVSVCDVMLYTPEFTEALAPGTLAILRRRRQAEFEAVNRPAPAQDPNASYRAPISFRVDL